MINWKCRIGQLNEHGERVHVKKGEKAVITSMKTIGNRNNVFKVVELSAGYKRLTTPRKQTLPKDAVNEILR